MLSTMKPVTPSSITSGTEPQRKAITGVPQAIASIITSAEGFGPVDREQQGARIAEEFGLSAIVDLADECRRRLGVLATSGAMTSSQYSRSTLSILAAILQRHAGCGGDALSRGQAASRARCGRGTRGSPVLAVERRRQQVVGQAVMDRCRPVDRRHRQRAGGRRSRPAAGRERRGRTVRGPAGPAGRAAWSPSACRGAHEGGVDQVDVEVQHVELVRAAAHLLEQHDVIAERVRAPSGRAAGACAVHRDQPRRGDGNRRSRTA